MSLAGGGHKNCVADYASTCPLSVLQPSWKQILSYLMQGTANGTKELKWTQKSQWYKKTVSFMPPLMLLISSDWLGMRNICVWFGIRHFYMFGGQAQLEIKWWTGRVILILMKFRNWILACCHVFLTASLVSKLFLFSLWDLSFPCRYFFCTQVDLVILRGEMARKKNKLQNRRKTHQKVLNE